MAGLAPGGHRSRSPALSQEQSGRLSQRCSFRPPQGPPTRQRTSGGHPPAGARPRIMLVHPRAAGHQCAHLDCAALNHWDANNPIEMSDAGIGFNINIQNTHDEQKLPRHLNQFEERPFALKRCTQERKRVGRVLQEQWNQTASRRGHVVSAAQRRGKSLGTARRATSSQPAGRVRCVRTSSASAASAYSTWSSSASALTSLCFSEVFQVLALASCCFCACPSSPTPRTTGTPSPAPIQCPPDAVGCGTVLT